MTKSENNTANKSTVGSFETATNQQPTQKPAKQADVKTTSAESPYRWDVC